MGEALERDAPITALDQFMTAKEVMERLRIAHRTLYRKIEEEGFPRPIRFNANCVRWREREVVAWVEAAAARNVEARV